MEAAGFESLGLTSGVCKRPLSNSSCKSWHFKSTNFAQGLVNPFLQTNLLIPACILVNSLEIQVTSPGMKDETEGGGCMCTMPWSLMNAEE